MPLFLDSQLPLYGVFANRQANNSELGLECREYTCDMGVSLSLLKDS